MATNNRIYGDLQVTGTSLTLNGVAVSNNSSSATLTNKTIDAANNTISNIANSNISASAAIAESKLNLDYSTSSLNTLASAALPSASFTDAAVTGKLITGFTSGAGSVAATDSILQAIQKLDGNVAGKEATLTKGNLSESTSSVLTITGGTSAVIGSGTTIEVKQASSSQSGFLSSTDWSTFNGKQAALGFTAENSANKNQNNGYAGLDSNGFVSITHIPPAALERLVMVADQAARFALTTATVQNGDVVKQTDTNLMYFVKDDTNLGNAGGYEAFSAGTASSVAWSGVTGTPTTLSGYGITDGVPSTRTVNGHALSADVTVTKGDVGLGNVDNTSDATKNSAVASLTNKTIDADLNTISNIANSQIKAAAAIALDKLAAVTASKVLVSDASGFVSASSVSTTTLGYVDATSSIQTQINGKLAKQTGDIEETSYTLAGSQAVPVSITGLAFANASVRAFEALVDVVNTTSGLFEVFSIKGIQKAAGWDIGYSGSGDVSGVVFSITSAGQVQATNADTQQAVIKFRAKVLSL